MNTPVEVVQKAEVSLNDFDRSLGTDEMNLAEFPLASLSTRTEPGQTTLQFEDSVHDTGTNSLVHRTLMITGSEHFGLPTATDNDILLVLIHLSNVRNRFRDKRVEFTRYELIKFLGWPPDGRAYKRLDESLMRWTTVTLHYKHAWWDRSGRRWKNRSFHVIGSLELRGRDDFRDDGRSSFTWDDVIFQSFQSGNLKRIDLNVYFNLKLAVSRQMYRFLDKRFWHKGQLEFDLRQFATEHIGLSRRYDAHEIKRKLTPAIKELQAIGFLTNSEIEFVFRKATPGKWLILLNKATAERVRDMNGAKWETELTSRGISRNVAGKLAEEYSPEHIAQKIRLLDALVANRDRRVSRNPAGFLASAIRHDYSDSGTSTQDSRRRCGTVKGQARMPPPSTETGRIDSRSGDSVRRLATTARSKWLPAKTDEITTNTLSASSDETIAFQKHWESLTDSEREQFRQEALEQAPPFHQKTLRRLKNQNGPLYQELTNQLVGTHWKMTRTDKFGV